MAVGLTLCSGVFAAITYNHFRYLESAACLDPHGRVWVAIASDKIALELKGHRAIPEALRGQMLCALPFVNGVIIQHEPTPEAIIRKLRPMFWVKGGDYDPNELANTPEGLAVRECGGMVVCTNKYDGPSTTELSHAGSVNGVVGR